MASSRGKMLLNRAKKIKKIKSTEIKEGDKTKSTEIKERYKTKSTEITFYCFKSKFKSSNESIFDNHMQYIHLIGPEKKRIFEKYLSKSHEGLLFSTLTFDTDEDTNDNSVGEDSFISGVESLTSVNEEERYPENEPEGEILNNDLIEYPDEHPPVNFVEMEVTPDTLGESIAITQGPPSPVAGPSSRYSPVHNVVRDITPVNATSDKSITLTPRPPTPINNELRDYVRNTPSGGIRGTPRRAVTVKGRKNLIPGAGTKKK